MQIEIIRHNIISALEKRSSDLKYLDELNFCLFNVTQLNYIEDSRFKDLENMGELKNMGLLTTDFDEYIEYAKDAHKNNTNMMYGCIGKLGNTYFIVSFKFRVTGNGKIRPSTALQIVPLFKFSPLWLAEYYISNDGKFKLKDIALKLKLFDFLNEENEKH